MGAVRVGVVGVGNCAASLVQRVHHYRDAAVEDRVPGLMHVKFGDYEYQVDVLVSYLPVGSEQADKHYAQCAIDAGVGFVNALRVFIASDPIWARKFSDAGVSIVGDDVKSQVGATITHRVLAKLFEDRGVKLERTYQLNFGGNMDFKNMLERSRLNSKKISKTQRLQDRHGPWNRRPGFQRELLFHEEPTRAVRRLTRARGGRAVPSRLILASTPLKVAT